MAFKLSDLSNTLSQFWDHVLHNKLAAVATGVAAAFVLSYGLLRLTGYHKITGVLLRFFGAMIRHRITGIPTEERLLRYVVEHAHEGDPDSVLSTIDQFSKVHVPMMHVGEAKGALLDEIVTRHHPKVAVEFGAYCGYSAVRTARLLQPDAHLYSIEFNPLYAAISTKIIEFAGLSSRVTVLIGKAEDKLPTLKIRFNINTIDMLFIDHWKALYVPDLKRAENQDYLKRGSVVIADNIFIPGAPEYAAYVRNSSKYTSTLHERYLDDSKVLKDAVMISVVEN